MLFNSFIFIFGFLPVAVVGFFLSRKLINHLAALLWLTAASLFFYGWWDTRYLWLIGTSIAFNFAIGQSLVRVQAGPQLRRVLLTFGVGANLVAIAYFKYANFFLDNLAAASGHSMGLTRVVLPLGISFFTFTQIAFLVDCYRRLASEANPLKYTLFVTYFPHLIAGPIIHHKAVMGQMSDAHISKFSLENLTVGLTIFVIGLFKKVAIADILAPYPDTIFYIADRAGHPNLIACWIAALSYALQIYFDFSGYSDMAIGLSRIFGIQLPINFNSPYKSCSVIEFWRRWHISLSRFLRDYLYYSIGGNRHGKFRRHVNLLVTMVLGGLWHGAGWTFLIWGALHGLYLVANHIWRGLRDRAAIPFSRVEHLVGWALTFGCVILAWVFFRATSVSSAWAIVRGLAGLNGIIIPDAIRTAFGRLPHGDVFSLPDGFVYAEIVLALFIACCLPNTSQIMSRYKPGVSLYEPSRPTLYQWRPSLPFAALAACLLFVSLALLNRPTDFIYFNF